MSLVRKFPTGSVLFIAALLAAAGLLLVAGCSSPTNPAPAFVAVTGITGVPTGGTAGTQVDLSGAVVAPDNANNKAIVWTVKEAGGTGVTTAGIVDGKFTPASAGTLKLTATIANGAAQGTAYTQDFDIAIAASGAFVPVTGISGVPGGGTAGVQVDLSGAAAVPSNAANKTIVWTVKDAGGTGVTTAGIVGNNFTPANPGTLVLTATIANGTAQGTNYTQDFTLAIADPGSFVAVTNITGVMTGGTAGAEVDLTGAVVTPDNATNKTIVWTVKDAGTTGVADAAGGKFTPAAAGTVTLTATISGGSAPSAAYIRDFDIIISEQNTFVAVVDITGVPTGGYAGVELDLSGAAAVPDNANNRTIVWSVKDAGATGATTAGIVNGKFTPANPGTVKLTATIANGSAQGTAYTRDFDIVISEEGSFVAVTAITGVPEEGVAGSPVSLAGAVVVPDTATYKTIVWRVTSPGATGVAAGNIDGNSFTPTTAGSLDVQAVISSGAGNMTPYTQDFTITIKTAFTAVTGIDGLSDRNAVTGALLNLHDGISVAPAGATNKTIAWSVSVPGDTGLTTADVETGSFTPANAGTATLTATIVNGLAQGSNYTQNITLVIIKPVTAINGVPSSGTQGYAVSLAGAVAVPADATNKTIVWTVNDAGSTGVTTPDLAGGTFTPANAGTLKLTATITNGSAIGAPFVQTYTITINESGTFTPGFDLGDDTSILLTDGSGNDLSKDTPNTVTKDSNYRVVIKGSGYTKVVWRLNGNPQDVAASYIYLPTGTERTINLSVEGEKGGKLESSGNYTFKVEE